MGSRTLGQHILPPFLDGELTIVRTDDDENSGLFRPDVDEAGARTWRECIQRGDWRLGWLYNWGANNEYRDGPEPYAELIQGDMFAMAVAALMYDPWLGRGGD